MNIKKQNNYENEYINIFLIIIKKLCSNADNIILIL